MPLSVILNGQPRSFEQLKEGSTLAELVDVLALKGDRIAVEHNGEIAPRVTWISAQLSDSDRIELVHFVGGG